MGCAIPVTHKTCLVETCPPTISTITNDKLVLSTEKYWGLEQKRTEVSPDLARQGAKFPDKGARSLIHKSLHLEKLVTDLAFSPMGGIVLRGALVPLSPL